MELTRRGIPFEIRSGLRFFEQAHIKDLIAYLRIIVNPRDEAAWKRVMGLYSRIGPKTVGAPLEILSEQEDPVMAALDDKFPSKGGKSAEAGLRKLRQTMLDITSGCDSISVPALIDRVLSNYRESLQQKYTEAQSREEDIEQLKGFSSKFPTLQEFLSDLALLTNMADSGEDHAVTPSGENGTRQSGP